jgi:hypothetical protein
MAQRRYGPTRGAGVAVIELEGEKGIEPGALGWCGYAGVMEKGPVGELIIAPNKSTFVKKCGGIIDDLLLPDAALDYYSLANGAGGLALVRVTDGNEVQAEIPLYARYGSLLTRMGILKAKNGGRWGGKERHYTADVDDMDTDLSNTTLDTGLAMAVDEWKGGILEIADVANTTYEIIGNDAAGVITVAADSTMKDDYDASEADPATDRYYLSLGNAGKAISIMIGDGEEKPDTEFSISVYVDGAFVKKYGNLSTNPSDSRYWVSLINNDDGNDEIEAEDKWTGAHTAAVRPANKYGIIAASPAVTDTVLTSIIHDFTITKYATTLPDPTFLLGTTTDDMIAQKITLVVTNTASEATATSDKFGDLGTVTIGSEFTPNNKWTPPFTLTNVGSTPLVDADEMVINYKPFIPDSLIGGYLYPDKVNEKSAKYRIVDNDHKSITVADGSDMTSKAEAADEYMVVVPLEMSGGEDGNASIDDSSYIQQAWDVDNSPFNRLFGRNMGLIKYATPGVTSTAVQKAGVAYAEAKNHQYRYEITSATVTEAGAITYINDTLGRSDFAVVAFPSYGTVPDPLSNEGKTKVVTLTGMIHGREARIAADYDGYHKAEAGIDAKLPKLLDITTSDAILNEELLNPAGIAIIKKVKGNFIIWGDRTVHSDPTWKWKHQRETMSYYEHVLQESFDWIIFMINDRTTESLAISALNSFFLPEYAKRAVRGNTFQEAVIIKLDEELNTDATRANGDMISEIKLRLADTVERFIIRIGKQGIFESVG